jgi:hypothetical protein
VQWIKENSLSLSMFCLFVGFLVADSATGLYNYNQQQATAGLPQVGYWQFLHTGTFLDGLFENWQAAILQLATLIIFSIFFRQRGASHSRKPQDEEGEKTKRPQRDGEKPASKSDPKDECRTWWQKTWLYRNSLSIAFLLFFCGAFAGHVIFGAKAYNEQRALLHQKPVSTVSYLTSANLWTNTFQTWEAEFVVMWFFLVASIYLRQEYSAESKALGAGIRDTGEANE